MYPPTTHDSGVFIEQRTTGEVLLARVASALNGRRSSELVLDRSLIADTIHEALEESQRARGVVQPPTTWWDAAAAAELLLVHVARTAK